MGEIVPAEQAERALYSVWAILAVEAGQLARRLLSARWSPEPAATAEGHEQEACPEIVCGACPDVNSLPCPAEPPCAAEPDPWQFAGAGACAAFAVQQFWRFVETRLLLWPVDEKMWCILALDGDVYVEPVTKNFDWGVLDTNPLDDVGTVPDEFPVRVYRFRDHPRADALKELIRDGRAVVRAELGREVEATAVGEDYLWLLTEPTDRRAIGTEIEAGAKVLLAPGGLDGLVKLDDHWRRVECMAPQAAPGFAKHRCDELKDGLGIIGGGPGVDESDLRDRLGRALPEAVGGTATPPAPPAAEWAVETGDLRALVIDCDGQGERYKPLKQVAQESSSKAYETQRMEGPPVALPMGKRTLQTGGDPRPWLREWLREKGIASTDRVAHELRALAGPLWLGGALDQVNIGGLFCIEAICRRMACIVAACANPAKPAWGLTRYCTGQMSAVDAVGPE
ncbi:unnamed protein product, partial [Prorocentrum cordatum]